jgi:phosphomevalonate kinase
VLVWTGTPADTTTLVTQVNAARGARTASALRELGDTALALAAAFAAEDAAGAVEVVARGAIALAALGAAAQAPLVPPIWREVHDLARVHGGAAKPTGAGGGDLLLAVFAKADDAETFRREAAGRGMTPVTSAVSPLGVDLQPQGEASRFPRIS